MRQPSQAVISSLGVQGSSSSYTSKHTGAVSVRSQPTWARRAASNASGASFTSAAGRAGSTASDHPLASAPSASGTRVVRGISDPLKLNAYTNNSLTSTLLKFGFLRNSVVHNKITLPHSWSLIHSFSALHRLVVVSGVSAGPHLSLLPLAGELQCPACLFPSCALLLPLPPARFGESANL